MPCGVCNLRTDPTNGPSSPAIRCCARVYAVLRCCAGCASTAGTGAPGGRNRGVPSRRILPSGCARGRQQPSQRRQRRGAAGQDCRFAHVPFNSNPGSYIFCAGCPQHTSCARVLSRFSSFSPTLALRSLFLPRALIGAARRIYAESYALFLPLLPSILLGRTLAELARPCLLMSSSGNDCAGGLSACNAHIGKRRRRGAPPGRLGDRPRWGSHCGTASVSSLRRDAKRNVTIAGRLAN